MSLGENIKKYRRLKGLKQSELAELSGVSRVAIGNYERGDRTPNVDVIGRISVALDVPFNDLIGNSFPLENDDNKALAYIISKGNYLEIKKSEILSDISFIATRENPNLDNFNDILHWLSCDEQLEIIDFLITAFKVKFYEIYSGERKDSIEHDINEIKKDLKDGKLFYPNDY